VLTLSLTVGVAGYAEADSVSIRSDADDTNSRLDVHYVTTRRYQTERLGRRTLSIAIESWDRFYEEFDIVDGGFYLVRLDTRGDERFDRWIYFYRSSATDNASELRCELRRRRGSHVDGGYDPDSTTEPTVVGCNARRAWLDIEHRVEFTVAAFEDHHNVDRAPDRGRYQGL
jgi:hypothetical protein